MINLNEWAEKTIEEIEKRGNTVIGGKICLRDSAGDNWFMPIFPELKSPKTERERVCDEIIAWLEPKADFYLIDFINVVKKFRDKK